MSSDAPTGYELVMPFVVCASNGGPFDDAAFVAGYEMGRLDHALRTTAQRRLRYTIRSDNLPQADLIAMRHGFRMESSLWEEHPDQWATATFIRTPVDG